jgi:hypothetical protein
MTTAGNAATEAAAADAVGRFRNRYRAAAGYDGPLPEVIFGADRGTADALAASSQPG